jgi:hypothetical protein
MVMGNPFLTDLKYLLCFFLIPVLTGCITFNTTTQLSENTKPISKKTVQKSLMSQEELQAAVLSYADRYIATIAQASLEFERDLPTPEARLLASRRRVYSVSAVAEIAAGPNPGPALLDMVVTTTLNRIVWDEYFRPQVFGMPATVMVDAYKTMEADVWDQAAKVMTTDQMDELKDVIIEWRINHPEQFAVDYIRFSDFGEIGRKPNLKEIEKPGGLLAPVKEATAAVDEMRKTSERAMFLLTKIQMIANFQAELAYKEFLFQPETIHMMDNMDQFRDMGRELTRSFNLLPEQLARERSAALNNVAELVAGERQIILETVSTLISRERTAVLNAFEGKDAKIRGIVQDVNATLDRLDKSFVQLQETVRGAETLVAGTERTGLVFKDLAEAVDKIAARFEPSGAVKPDAPVKNFDIGEYTDALVQFQETAGALKELMISANQTTDKLATSFLKEFNESSDKRVDHIFFRLIQLCLVVAGVVLAVYFLISIIRRRHFK